MATTIAEIIALWADLEYQLAMLLTNIIGVSESPTLAIFSILQTQQLQAAALKAAAQSALTSSDYEVFAAGIAVADSVDTARHQLAHWLWAKCEQRPDLLCLVDPRKLKGREIESGSLPLEAYQCILALSAVSGQLRPGLLRSQFHPRSKKI